MAFEKFTMTGRGFKPKISIYGKAQIGFNQGSTISFELVRYGYVVFYYDKENRKIGLSFTDNAEEEGAKKLKFRGTGASVSAKAFFDYYVIPYGGKAKEYDVQCDKENGLYIIELNKECEG